MAAQIPEPKARLIDRHDESGLQRYYPVRALVGDYIDAKWSRNAQTATGLSPNGAIYTSPGWRRLASAFCSPCRRNPGLRSQ